MMNTMQHRYYKSGFSLLELLVVIAIIGILMTIGAVAFSTAQQRSRDARRRGDIHALQQAYEQYYADEGDYSISCDNLGNLPEYMPAGQPLDPRSGSSYTCSFTSDKYCVCGLLEGENSGNAVDSPIDGVCSYGAGDYYCLSNLQ